MSATLPIDQAMRMGLQHHQAGRLAEAEAIYRQVLSRDPNVSDALYLLGMIASQFGHFDDAIDLIGRAIAIAPNQAIYHLHIGNALASGGKTVEAVAAYTAAIRLKPDYAEAHNGVGNMLRDQGRLAEAVIACSKAIQLKPDFPQAYNNLGNALKEQGKLDEAAAAYHAAIRINAAYSLAYNNLSAVYKAQGRLDEAIALCATAIQLKPDDPSAYNSRANALVEQAKISEAIEDYRHAIRVRPDFAAAHNNLGNALLRLGKLETAATHPYDSRGDGVTKNPQLEAAMAAYATAVRLNPNFADAHNNLGNCLHDIGDHAGASAAFSRAIELKSGYAEAHSNLGDTLLKQGKRDEAIAAYRTAIRLNPGYASAHSNLAGVLREIGELDESLAQCRAAIAIKPDHAEAQSNLGAVLQDLGDIDGAIASYSNAIQIDPEFAGAYLNRGMARLLNGDLFGGWADYEWRWKSRDSRFVEQACSAPRWTGDDLRGRSILLQYEQGFGDTIQFVRYAPLVAARGGRVVITCQPELLQIFQSCPQLGEIIHSSQPLPPIDLHCPMLSLPLVFKTDLNSVPPPAPLKASTESAALWSDRLKLANGLRKVGLVWAGNPSHKGDRTRSLPFAQLSLLSTVRKTTFFSLQKGPAAESAKNPPTRMALIDLAGELRTFADTAAVISNLDLVIAVDTAVAHLAGSLGKPVWLLLPFAPDWRWLRHRDDSPWYPIARLFRQTVRGDWDAVIQRVADALAAM